MNKKYQIVVTVVEISYLPGGGFSINEVREAVEQAVIKEFGDRRQASDFVSHMESTVFGGELTE